jgi:polyhydroxyalkanoate synthesis regulator phasin
VPKKDTPKKKSSSDEKSSSNDKSDKQQKPTRGDAVRSAAAQAIEATAGQAGFTRERAQQLADELVQAAGRFRETLEDLRPAGSDELRSLREQITALEQRVAKLERAPKRPPRRRRTTPAKSSGQSPPAKPPASPQPEPPPPSS